MNNNIEFDKIDHKFLSTIQGKSVFFFNTAQKNKSEIEDILAKNANIIAPIFCKIENITDDNLANIIFLDDIFVWTNFQNNLSEQHVFDFIYCDVSDEKNMDVLYQHWIRLRKITQKLYLKVFVYGQLRYLFYDFSNPIEISVIFPIYNSAPYLAKCFQNFFNFKPDFIEFIAVNDGSPDNALEILENFQKTEKRLKIFNKPNAGAASTRMFGLEKAKGKYINFIDPDDFVEENFLAKLHANAVFGQCEVTQCNFNFYDENTKKIEKAKESKEKYFRYNQPYYSKTPLYKLLWAYNPAMWRRFYLRDFLIQYQIEFPISIKSFDDLPFYFKLAMHCKSFLAIPEFLYNYYLHPKQDMATIRDKRLFMYFDIFKILETYFIQDNRQEKVEKNLLLTRLMHHSVAFTKLPVEYQEEYIDKLIHDFSIHSQKKWFSFWSILNILGLRRKKNRRKIMLLLGILFEKPNCIKKYL